MKYPLYIILYPDRAISLCTSPLDTSAYQKGSRFFKCEDMTPLAIVSAAYASSWNTNNPGFPSELEEIAEAGPIPDKRIPGRTK